MRSKKHPSLEITTKDLELFENFINKSFQDYFKTTIKELPKDIPQMCIMIQRRTDLLEIRYDMTILDIGTFTTISDVKVYDKDFSIHEIENVLKNISVLKDYDMDPITEVYTDCERDTLFVGEALADGLLFLNINTITSIFRADDDTYLVEFMNGESVNCLFEEVQEILKICERKGRYDLLL